MITSFLREQPHLHEALEAARGVAHTPAVIARLCKKLPSNDVQWALRQWQYRDRAKAKFTNADHMLFTKEALEQASHEEVATYHASLFPSNTPVADLTVGIGADLIALARRGPAIGFELDEERATYARHNLEVHGLHAEIHVADSLTTRWDFDCVFADPSRRSQEVRHRDLAGYRPEPFALAKRMETMKIAVMKLGPLAKDEDLEALGPDLTFVSHRGECKEALITLGIDCQPRRSAVQIPSGVRIDAGSAVPPQLSVPESYFFDADPAAVRAHCLGTLCDLFGLAPLGSSPGYLTGESPATSPWLQAFLVRWHGRADVREVNQQLARLRLSPAVLKQRGCGLDLEIWKRRLKGGGAGAGIVAFYVVGESKRAAILEPA
jgi:hypothetical protein